MPEDGGHVFKAKTKVGGIYQEIDIDNCWTVPHNPVRLRMFDAHINVEYCNSVKSIHYSCNRVILSTVSLE